MTINEFCIWLECWNCHKQYLRMILMENVTYSPGIFVKPCESCGYIGKCVRVQIIPEGPKNE